MVHTLTQLRNVLEYKPRKGHFVWLVHRKSHGHLIKPGEVAGTKSVGRVAICYEGARYRAHRLAFLFMTGKWPPKDKIVDHKDGDDGNNKWSNLRLVTRRQNNCNRHHLRSDNKSGANGVSWSIVGKGWTARVTVNTKVIHLGYYGEDLEAAIKARREAELKYYGAYAPRKK